MEVEDAILDRFALVADANRRSQNDEVRWVIERHVEASTAEAA